MNAITRFILLFAITSVASCWGLRAQVPAGRTSEYSKEVQVEAFYVTRSLLKELIMQDAAEWRSSDLEELAEALSHSSNYVVVRVKQPKPQYVIGVLTVVLKPGEGEIGGRKIDVSERRIDVPISIKNADRWVEFYIADDSRFWPKTLKGNQIAPRRGNQSTSNNRIPLPSLPRLRSYRSTKHGPAPYAWPVSYIASSYTVGREQLRHEGPSRLQFRVMNKVFRQNFVNPFWTVFADTPRKALNFTALYNKKTV